MGGETTGRKTRAVTRRQVGGRRLKKRVHDLLKEEALDDALSQLLSLPLRRVVNPLISLFCSTDQLMKWRAVTAAGTVTAKLAESEPESARVIMRRFMWMLNDESGGVGWGAPEAMAESMVQSEMLAEEYAPILVSYMDEEGNYLELEGLQRGLLWGIQRLAEERPELLSRAVDHLEPFLRSRDDEVRAMAALAAGKLHATKLRDLIAGLVDDDSPVELYGNDALERRTVGDLANEALSVLN